MFLSVETATNAFRWVWNRAVVPLIRPVLTLTQLAYFAEQYFENTVDPILAFCHQGSRGPEYRCPISSISTNLFIDGESQDLLSG